MADKKPRKQHFISKGYQKQFCNTKQQIFIYYKRERKGIFSNPSNQLCETDFQTLFSYERSLDYFILERECAKIENDAIEAIRYVIDNKKMPEKKRLGDIINLMGLFFERNSIKKKAMRQQFKPIDDWKNDDIIMTMMNKAADFADFLGLQMSHWLILEANDSEFISSDHPVNLVKLKDASIEWIVIFPLSSHIALMGSSSRLSEYALIEHDVVDGINYYTAYQATTLISSRELPLPSEGGAISLRKFLNSIDNTELGIRL